jgi:malate synthase
LWQWLYHKAILSDGRPVTLVLYEQLLEEEVAKLKASALCPICWHVYS